MVGINTSLRPPKVQIDPLCEPFEVLFLALFSSWETEARGQGG